MSSVQDLKMYFRSNKYYYFCIHYLSKKINSFFNTLEMCLLFSDIKFPFSCSTSIYMYNNTSLTCTPNKKNRYVLKHIVFQIRDFRKRSSTFDVLNTQPGSPNPVIFNSTIGQYTRSLGYLCQKLVPPLIFIRLLIDM